MAIGKEFWKEALEMLEIKLQLATTLDKITFFWSVASRIYQFIWIYF